MKTKLITAGLALVLVLTGCTQAPRVSHNLAREAENFEVTRRLAVINTITDTPQFELIGNFSIHADQEDGQLEVTVKADDGTYKKHFVGLAPTVTYVVEDLSGADVSNVRYQISYLPEAIVPIELKKGN